MPVATPQVVGENDQDVGARLKRGHRYRRIVEILALCCVAEVLVGTSRKPDQTGKDEHPPSGAGENGHELHAPK